MAFRPAGNLAALHSICSDWGGRLRLATLAILYVFTLARPGASITNRFFNSDLDSDTVGWVLETTGVPPGWDAEDRDGCAGSGSAIVFSRPIAGQSAAASQCIPVFGGEILQVEIEARTLLAPDPVLASVYIYYTTGGCGLEGFGTTISALDSLPFATWSRLAAAYEAPPGALSAWVGFALSSPSPFIALFDGAYASVLPFRIFSDDFEYGSTCRW